MPKLWEITVPTVIDRKYRVTAESAEQSRPSLYSDKDDSGPTRGQAAQERPPSPTKPPPQPQKRPNILMKPKDDN